MQNIETDLKFAIEKILCGTWRERKQMVDKVFTVDAKFWCSSCPFATIKLGCDIAGDVR